MATAQSSYQKFRRSLLISSSLIPLTLFKLEEAVFVLEQSITIITLMEKPTQRRSSRLASALGFARASLALIYSSSLTSIFGITSSKQLRQWDGALGGPPLYGPNQNPKATPPGVDLAFAELMRLYSSLRKASAGLYRLLLTYSATTGSPAGIGTTPLQNLLAFIENSLNAPPCPATSSSILAAEVGTPSSLARSQIASE